MTLDEAQKLIGTKRIHPVSLSARKRLPVPGSGGTIHECLRIEGECGTGIDDTGKYYHFEDYEKAWVTTAGWARQIATDFPPAWQVASRFIAGKTIQDAIRAAQEVNQSGLSVTLNYLGESVETAEDAAAAREAIFDLMRHIHLSGVNATVSVKPTQLGLHLSTAVIRHNLQQLLTAAEKYDTRVRIDMEDSSVTDTTLELYRSLRDEDGFGRRVGIVIQAYLYRTEGDIRALIQEGAWVRLCKGAYKEPHDLAFPQKADTDTNFLHLAQ